MRLFTTYTSFDIEQIAKNLDPKAIRGGRGWLTKCPLHASRKGGNLSLGLGQNQNLIVHCFSGCNPIDLLKEIGREGVKRFSSTPISVHPDDDAEDQRKQEWIKNLLVKIWEETKPIEGTLGEAYLRSRGIAIPLPSCLRFHHALAYYERDQKTGKPRLHSYHPVLISKIQAYPSDDIIAIHRTYLASDGKGKAHISQPKMILGKYQGGAVQFGTPQGKLLLAEGIETALSVYEATGICTWSALSASGFANLILPSLETVSG